VIRRHNPVSIQEYVPADNLDLILMSHGWRDVDHAQIHKCAVEAAFPFRGRCEVGFATMLEKARARGRNLIKRQTSLLQSYCPKKSNIQVRAPPGKESTGAVIQRFHGIERAELAPRVYRELEFCLDPSSHYGLMISVVHDQRWTPGKAG
jgi:hypothetical protein